MDYLLGCAGLPWMVLLSHNHSSILRTCSEAAEFASQGRMNGNEARPRQPSLVANRSTLPRHIYKEAKEFTPRSAEASPA